MEFPTDPKPSEEEMVAAYVKTLAAVLGRYAPCLCGFVAVLLEQPRLNSLLGIESVNVYLL